MYTLEQLRMFVAAAETGSFSAAARKLGKSQSVVSQGIINMEIDFDIALFERSGRSPVLTEQGRALFMHARSLLQHHYRMEQAVSSFAGDHETRLVLALDEALLLPGASNMLKQFAELFPATQLTFISVASPDAPGLVESGAADLGLMFAAPGLNPKLDSVFIGLLPFVAVAAFDHPLSAMKSVELSDLAQYRQLLVKGVEGQVLRDFDELGPDIWWCNNLYMLRELALQGFGWSYIPRHLLEEEHYSNQLKALPVEIDYKAWSLPVERISAPGHSRGPAFTWLADNILDLLDQK
ncbi:LysR family transcriptional regulator [Spongorhabdus nitratireducens]